MLACANPHTAPKLADDNIADRTVGIKSTTVDPNFGTDDRRHLKEVMRDRGGACEGFLPI